MLEYQGSAVQANDKGCHDREYLQRRLYCHEMALDYWTQRGNAQAVGFWQQAVAAVTKKLSAPQNKNDAQ